MTQQIDISRYEEMRASGKARVIKVGTLYALQAEQYDQVMGSRLDDATIIINLDSLRADAEIKRREYEALAAVVADCEALG